MSIISQQNTKQNREYQSTLNITKGKYSSVGEKRFKMDTVICLNTEEGNRENQTGSE